MNGQTQALLCAVGVGAASIQSGAETLAAEKARDVFVLKAADCKFTASRKGEQQIRVVDSTSLMEARCRRRGEALLCEIRPDAGAPWSGVEDALEIAFDLGSSLVAHSGPPLHWSHLFIFREEKRFVWSAVNERGGAVLNQHCVGTVRME